MKYIAGWNMPGYLPESDPEEFDSFEDARDYIADELERIADENADVADDDPDYEGPDDLADEVDEQTGPFTILAPNGYVYWVVRE